MLTFYILFLRNFASTAIDDQSGKFITAIFLIFSLTNKVIWLHICVRGCPRTMRSWYVIKYSSYISIQSCVCIEIQCCISGVNLLVVLFAMITFGWTLRLMSHNVGQVLKTIGNAVFDWLHFMTLQQTFNSWAYIPFSCIILAIWYK